MFHIADYQQHFINRTKNNFIKAETYIKGIVKSELRNIGRISEDTGADDHQMQHFITESNWEARKVINQVATEVSTILPKRKLTGLIIDESGRVKKGDKSVGVGWQYCGNVGNVGKISNSQVAVFACLSNGDFASMVDDRLYLPKDWCDDPDRCDEAGIPKESRGFKTKLELAVDIIHQQVANTNY
ncbi:MAG TPA: transposase [Bacteroidales bacterium]|nr:transposase [Bacteroidales bacterium]HPR57574.1 transposase [Bacteroidales bacterium]HRW96151.1 transposase [Bacteroidales bacterium]